MTVLFTVTISEESVASAAINEVGVEWWWNKDKKPDDRQVDEIPQPEGGPEFDGRVRQPVSNIILQQRYPETVVLRGPMTENRVALTFDDGPDPRFTPQLLDVLSKFNVPATFFVMGARAEAYPEITKRMANEGHIIGNHTYWHPNLVQENIASLKREIRQTEDVIADLVGYRTKLFRPPYGFLYNELVEEVAELNYTIIGWSLDTLDWRELGADNIAYNVINNIEPGSIILMHDGGEWDADRTGTIESLKQIIPVLQEQGFEFVTVPELLSIPYKK
ncbi:polysaccharide deacetylase family protein [Bacillus sp. YZJH907-2]|uniref:Polysaccharide deacetylase family protein n=2 Tax=Halalkalibacter suaedae TaxID=2822140 RepID=A0A940WUP7_9BACI|nr:polysaccharide deacetylase family protein [Bacillus suaedae]